MNELILHVLMIWALLASIMILFYEKFVVDRQMERNMYVGKGRGYNKKKARSSYVRSVLVSGVVALGVVYILSLLA